MSEWQTTSLSDLCSDISYGYTASAKQTGGGPKFLRITDIVPDRINWSDVPYCDASEKDIQKYKLKNGDIVIARTGATTGYNKLIKDISFDAVFASYLIRYEIDERKAHPEYVGHVLQSVAWRDYVDAIAGGSAQPGANAKQLGSFELAIPPIPEQKSIAAVLSSLDDKIDLLHRQNQTLEAMAATLFRQWFVEEAQEDWEDGSLGDVIDIFDGQRIPLSRMERDKKKDGVLYPYYGAAQIMDYINDYIFDGEYILLGEDGTVRTDEGYPVLQYATGKFWVNNHTHVLKAKAPYSNYFLWNYLLKKNIDQIVTGAVQPKINQGNLKSLSFPRYPKDLVMEFNEIVEPMLSKSQHNKAQIALLGKLRDNLLPKLMSGEVRVAY